MISYFIEDNLRYMKVVLLGIYKNLLIVALKYFIVIW